MNFAFDLLSLFLSNLALFSAEQPRRFGSYATAGLVLAVLCWVICSRYTRLWNLRYRLKVSHHLLCGLAATCTLLFAVLYPSLVYMQQTAQLRIAWWEQGLKVDKVWEHNLLIKQYDAVKSLNIEDFTRYPPLDQPGANGVPIVHDKSRQTCAQLGADEAVRNFHQRHRFLGMILHAEASVPAKTVEADIQNYFVQNVSNSYPSSRGISLAAAAIGRELDEQTPRVVTICRFAFITLFALIQLFVFSIIGIAAYKDLKVVT